MSSSALTVEITEDFILGNLDRARLVLTGLRRIGIGIAIDDFGSGYSSLYYLNELPIDEVKLDRSFLANITEDPRAAAIVRSVIDLSHTLGLTTVAEGVETSATATVLTRLRLRHRPRPLLQPSSHRSAATRPSHPTRRA